MKDMSELEELIAEIKANRRFDALEMEFIHTRAKGILQLMQMFKLKEERVTESSGQDPQKVEKQESYTEREEPVSENKPEKIEISAETKTVGEEKPHSLEQDKNEFRQNEPEVEKPVSPPEIPVQENMIPEEPAAADREGGEDDDDVLEEESEIPETGSRLGDSFLKGKSVNDLITDQNKLEFKLSNRPVSSIQAAIGINDRFQYIRELFDNDSEKFLEAVKTLDSSENIKVAVDYLRHNFKWKKNETSLKFVNLVKRRFLNE